MQSLNIADIFFIITGTAVVIITILLIIASLYIISFVRTIRMVAKTARKATEIVSEDVIELSKNIKDKGFHLKSVAQFVKNISKKK